MTDRRIPLHTLRTLLRMCQQRHPHFQPVAVAHPGTGGIIALLDRRITA